HYSSASLTDVLSNIDPHKTNPTALEEFYGIHHLLIRFDDVVALYPGFEACTQQHIEKVLAFGELVYGTKDSHVLIHCHAGISRSTAAAAILMCQHAPGREEEAFLKLLDLRKHGWPNTRMVEFADTLLKRDGAMMNGLLAYRRAMIEAKPHLRE